MISDAFLGFLRNVMTGGVPSFTLDAGLTVRSPTSGIGYSTGAGGVITQQTDKSTGVLLNKPCGVITMNNAALNAGVEVSFVLTNSLIGASDVVAVCQGAGGTAGAYLFAVAILAAGACTITVSNASAGNLSEAVTINFVVLKGAAA
jgi:hypothetical protein